MADGHKARPDTDSRGDTVEFAALSPEGAHEQRRELELVGNFQVPVKKEFRYPVELRLGRDERTPICYLVRYPWQSGQRYAIVQPEVVRSQPGRGWVEFGEATEANNYTTYIRLGRQATPQLEFGPDVSQRSLRRLARELGADPKWLTRLEHGDFRSPAPERLARIAELLDIDPERIDRITRGHLSENLPEMRTYFRATISELSDGDIDRIEKLVTKLRREHGGDGG